MCCLNLVNDNYHQKLESFEVHHFRFRKSQFRRAQSKETTLPFCTRKLEGHPMGLNDAIIWSSETSPVSCRSSDDAWSRTPAIDVTCLWCEEDAASLKSKTACCKTVDEGQQGSVSVDGQQNEALCDENARQLPIKEDECLANNTGIKACTVFLNPAIFSPNPRRFTKRMCCSKSSLSLPLDFDFSTQSGRSYGVGGILGLGFWGFAEERKIQSGFMLPPPSIIRLPVATVRMHAWSFKSSIKSPHYCYHQFPHSYYYH